MQINWQRRHERILAELDALAGKKVQQFDRDTAHLSPEDLAYANVLNGYNSEAVQNYYAEGTGTLNG